MIKKKHVIVLSVLCFSLSLSSCNKNEANSSNGKTKVTFWHTHNDDESKTLESIVEDYESKHPEIDVEMQQVPFSDAQNKYKTVAQAKDAPDIFRSEIAWTAEFASLGYLMALDMYMTPEYTKNYLKAPLKI
jgi:arabinogalactan oligomer/maltooligosaccharide transport system substrate-binding protein